MNAERTEPAIDRETLYEEVWATPMTHLGKKYGISGTAIRSLCDKLQIPVPSMGHWVKLEAGRTIARPPLPPLVERAAPVKKVGRPRKMRPEFKAVKQTRAPLPLKEPQAAFTEVPEPTRWHPALANLRASLAKASSDAIVLKKVYDWEQAHPGKRYPSREKIFGSWEYFCDEGQLLGTRHSKSPARLSFSSYQRGLAILNMLCERAQLEGYEVRIDKEKSRIQLVRADAYVALRISEKLEVGFRARVRSWDKSIEQVRRLIPTGRLALFIEQQGRAQTEIVEKPGHPPLQNKLEEILKVIARRHEGSVAKIAAWAQRDREFAVQRARREDEERTRKEAARLAEEERARRTALIAETENWQRADLVRRYIASLDAKLEAGAQPAEGHALWREWALQVAQDLDFSSERVRPANSGDAL